MDTSSFDAIDPSAVEDLLSRAKQRSAQLRRRRFLLFSGIVTGLDRTGDGIRRGRAGGPPRRFSPLTLALGSIGVVVALVIALVVVGVTSRGPGAKLPVSSQPGSTTVAGGSPAPVDTLAPASVVQAVTGVTPVVANAVGLPATSVVAPPTVMTGQPALTIDGLPGAVFISGEFCPYCAAERWAIVMAFGRFGSFSNLSETVSSPWDSYPSTPTFSFYGATYTSPDITLEPVEHVGNDTTAVGTHAELQPLTTQESDLWQTYDQDPGYPFLDIGNTFFVMSPSYVPTVLAGLDQADVAAKLTNPDDPVTVAIVGTANYLTAAICSVLGSNAPTDWCSQPVIVKAAQAMGVSLG